MSYVNVHGYDEESRQWRNMRVDDKGFLISSESTTGIGSYGNLHSGSLNPMSGTSELDVSLYKESIISYSDLSPASVGSIAIYGSMTNPAVSWHYLGKLVPIANASATKREAVAVLKLAPFKKVYAYNESTTETQASAVISVVSN